MINKNQNFSKFYLLILMGFFIASIFSGLKIFGVDAQSDQGWSQPTNLSYSGGASNPEMTIDSNGVIYVLWRDFQNGITFTSNVDGEWSPPTATNSPFISYIPKLLSDDTGNIHAFWLDERNILRHSRIVASNFGLSNSWTNASVISDNVITFESSLDQQGSIHLSFIRNINSDTKPAGIYYTKLVPNGTSWSFPTLLYQSDYLRSIENDSANIKIANIPISEAESTVFVVWDNLPLRRVYIIKSSDGGQSWDPYLEIDGPSNTSGLSSPFNIDISANQEDIVLVWQVGQKGVSCSQYSKHSNDGGVSWSESQRILRQLSSGGCPQENQIIGNTEDFSVLMTNLQGQIFLTAWNGNDWSDPQLQTPMSSFIDPISFANIDLHCHLPSIELEHLFVVGCDNGAGNDVWYIDRPLGNIQDWFPPPSAWADPRIITTSIHEFNSIQAVADNSGGVHSIWLQPTGVFYSNWDGNKWLEPSQIISTPITKIDQLAATIDLDGILYLVWTRGDTGEIYFSWANSSSATHKNDWTDPQLLPSPQLLNKSPDIYIDDTGNIFITYSVAINEGRGVYLIKSNDRGISWSEPNQIHDAVSSGWEMVDQTRVSKVGDNTIISSWVQSSARSGPLGLYFAAFTENESNIDSTLVVSKPVIWNELMGDGSNIQRVWQELDDGNPEIWHSYSADIGETWAQPFFISSIGESPGIPSIIIDRSSQLHLTYLTTRDDDLSQSLKHWIWDGEIWQSVVSLDLGEFEDNRMGNIATSLSSNDEIFSLFSQVSQLAEDNSELYTLLFTKRHLNISESPIETVSSPSTTEIPVPSPTLTTDTSDTSDTSDKIEAPKTPTPLPTQQIQKQPASSTLDSLTGLVLGIGLALLLVVITFFIRLALNRRN